MTLNSLDEAKPEIITLAELRERAKEYDAEKPLNLDTMTQQSYVALTTNAANLAEAATPPQSPYDVFASAMEARLANFLVPVSSVYTYAKLGSGGQLIVNRSPQTSEYMWYCALQIAGAHGAVYIACTSTPRLPDDNKASVDADSSPA
jgi:hypothetical protein